MSFGHAFAAWKAVLNIQCSSYVFERPSPEGLVNRYASVSFILSTISNVQKIAKCVREPDQNTSTPYATADLFVVYAGAGRLQHASCIPCRMPMSSANRCSSISAALVYPPGLLLWSPHARGIRPFSIEGYASLCSLRQLPLCPLHYQLVVGCLLCVPFLSANAS